MVQPLRLHLDQVAGHAAAFQLEYAGGLTVAQQLKGLRIVKRDVVQVEPDAVPLLDHLTGPLHDCQRDQSQEVDLEHAQRVEHAHFELSHGLDGSVL